MRRQIDSALVAVAVTVFWVTLAAPSVGFSQNPPMPDMPMPNMPSPAATPAEQRPSIETGLTLAELEEMAVTHNPTLAQAAAERGARVILVSGPVTLVAPGALPNDGKVIADERKS